MEDKLYEIIGRLFTEGRDMQSLTRQLQSSNNELQALIKRKDEELAQVHQELTKVKSKVLNGPEQA